MKNNTREPTRKSAQDARVELRTVRLAGGLHVATCYKKPKSECLFILKHISPPGWRENKWAFCPVFRLYFI